MMELRLRGVGGQGCIAILVVRDDGSRYVRFESRPEYGMPSLEERDLSDLARRLRELR